MNPIAPQPLLRRRGVVIPLAIGVIILLVAVVLSFFVRDFVRQAIVVPVAYAAWLIDLVIRSIPQSTFWGVIVAAAILVAWRSLASTRAAALLHRRAAVPIVTDHSGQSTFSARLEYISRLNDSSFAREKLAFELRQVVVKLLSHHERLPEDEIERRIRTHELVRSPDVNALLTSWQTWLNPPRADSPIRFLEQWWRKLTRTPATAAQPDAALMQRLLRTIEYMETLMNGGPLDGQPEGKHE